MGILDKRHLLSEMPEALEKVLKEKNLLEGKALVFAEADMDVDCEFREHVFILTDTCLLHGSAQGLTDERIPYGIRESAPDYGEYLFEKTEISRLSSPGIDTLVVGGIFRAYVDGVEKPVCAFTNAYKGRIMRLCELLKNLIEKKEIRGDRLYEERREEVCPKCGMPYPNKAHKVCPRCMDKRKIFFRLASFFRPHAPMIAVICLMSILTAAISAVWPQFSGSILYDGILAKNKENFRLLSLIPTDSFAFLLLMLSITMAVSKLLQQLFGIIQGRIVAKIVPDVVSTLKKRVFSSIQLLSVSFFTNRRTGGLMSRIMSDAGQVSDIFIDGIPQILPNLFTIVFSFAVMFRTNWILALAAIASFPPVILVSFKLRPRLWHYHSRQFQSSRDLRARLSDNLTGARVVKAFGMEQGEAESLGKFNDRVQNAQMDSVGFEIRYNTMYRVVHNISTILTWALGACFVLKVIRPEMTYGTLITFTGYVSLLSGPVDFFSYIFRQITSSMNAAQRIFEILDAKPDVAESLSPVAVDEIKGEIRLENVSFGYEENREVLKDISLTVKPGEMLGIVGKSGAGKSTLANLITRLYDVGSGHIYIDGIDVRDMSFSDIRKAVALVSQETYIFRGSIYDNIAYAKPDADRETVLKAAIAAGAHNFICRLPDGYDTFVGSGGRSLSGGERQRISIARAILADPRILILDEATAAVDTETERNIQAALQKLVKGRTTLSIAHRISTLRDADELIVIEDGRIVEQGTHDELIRQKGVYFKLLGIQNKALALRTIGG